MNERSVAAPIGAGAENGRGISVSRLAGHDDDGVGDGFVVRLVHLFDAESGVEKVGER